MSIHLDVENNNMKKETVDNPLYYKEDNIFEEEIWKMMVDIFGKDAFISFCRLNSFKYRMRAGKKSESGIMDDISKAIWYENKLKSL